MTINFMGSKALGTKEMRLKTIQLTGSLCVCSCLARSEEFENFFVQLNS